MSCSSGNLSDEAGKSSQNFQVCVRIRPLNSKEEQQTTKRFHSIIQTQDNMLFVYDPTENSIKDIIANSQNGSVIQSNSTFGCNTNASFCVPQPNRRPEKEFIFDSVFDERTSTEQVFKQSILPSIDHVLSGYNSTVFAYGMTGAGKTHTIFGNLQNSGQSSSDGIALMTLNALQAKASNSTNQIVFKFSYLEIYNENIRDLMVENSENLMVVEDSQKGVFVPDLTDFLILHPDDIRKYIIQGNTRRIMAATAANQFSSRSHAIIQIICEQKNHGQNLNILSKLCIVDLAGSERGAVTENRGVRLQEGANINRSLLALGNCINLLSDSNKKGSFVPYRDSKLTRLLKESLGGNTRSIMIACISPSSLCYEETVNTLKYAVRARCIKKTVKKNTSEMAQHVSEYKMIISGLRSEIVALHEQLKDKSNENQLLKIKQNVMPMLVEDKNIYQEDKGIQNVEEIGQMLFENLEEHWEISTTIEEIINLNKISENYIIEKEERLNNRDVKDLSAEEAQECTDEIAKRREVIQSNQEILAEMNAKLEKNIEFKKQLHIKIKNIGNTRVSHDLPSNSCTNINLSRLSEQFGIDTKEDNYVQSNIKDNQILEMQKKMHILEEELKNKDKLLQQKQTIIQNLTENEVLMAGLNSSVTTKLASKALINTNNTITPTSQPGISKKLCLSSNNKNSHSLNSQPQQQQPSTNYYCPSQQQQTNVHQFYLKIPKEMISERRASNSSPVSHVVQVSSIVSQNYLGFNDSLRVSAERSGLKRQSSSNYYSNSNNCSQNEDMNCSSKKNKYSGNKHNFSQHQTSNVEPISRSNFYSKQSSSKNNNNIIENCTFNLSSRQAVSSQSHVSLQGERPSSNSSSKTIQSQSKNGQCQKKIINGMSGIRLFENLRSGNIEQANTMVISIQELKSCANKLKDADFINVGIQDTCEQDNIGEKFELDSQEQNSILKDQQKLESQEGEVINIKFNEHEILGEEITENEGKQIKNDDDDDCICENEDKRKLNEIQGELQTEEEMNTIINEKIQQTQQQQQQQPQLCLEEQLRGKCVRNFNQEYEINSYASARKRVRELKERLSRLCDNPSNANSQTPQNHPTIQCENGIAFQDLQSLNQLQSLRNNSSNNIKNNTQNNQQHFQLPFSKPANLKKQNNENQQQYTAQDSLLQQQFNSTASNFNTNKKKILQDSRSSHLDNCNSINTNSTASYTQQQQLRMLKRGGQGDMSSKNNTINPQNCLKSINNNLNHLTDFSSQIMSTKNTNQNSNSCQNSNKTKLPRGMLSQINQNYAETPNYSKKTGTTTINYSSNQSQSSNYKDSKVFHNPNSFLSPNHQSSFNNIRGQPAASNGNKSPRNGNKNNNKDREFQMTLEPTKHGNQENNENMINL